MKLKKFSRIIATSLLAGACCFTPVYATSLDNSETYTDAEEEVVEDSSVIIKDSTEEKFLESLAEKEGISVDEAKELNEQTIANAIGSTNSLKRANLEVVKYKTVEKNFSVNDDITIVIATEVEYLYSNTSSKAIEILDSGNPYVGVEGWSDSEWNGNDPTISETSSSIRISTTGQAALSIDVSGDIGIDLDGLSLGGSIGGTTTYYSKVKTYVMNIKLSGSSLKVS